MSTRSRCVRNVPRLMTALTLLLCASAVIRTPAQKPPRLNRIIETLEQGQPVINNQEFRFFDMEHSPFQMSRLEAYLEEMGKDRDANGRLKVTPMVRIPQEGDEQFRWSIKQMLDSGVFAVVVPKIETKEQGLRAVRAMRYPPQAYTQQREPLGERGWGPGRAIKYWGISQADYARKADLWPLNPEGELFLVFNIESELGVKNIKEILEVPGVGAVMLAPNDLSMSLGIGPPPVKEHPKLEEAYQSFLKACKAQNRVICGCADYNDKMKQRLSEGFRYFFPLG